jgi:glycosyltransferase involved in cell wall biosynthesis
VKSFLRRLLGRAAEMSITCMAADTPSVGRRLMVFTEHFNATYYISFDIPLRELHAQGEVSFRAYDQQAVAEGGAGCWRQWLDRFQPEVVFLTRYGQADGVDIIQDCCARGIPVVYHIDDNLLDLPPSLGAEIVKRQGAAAQARRLMLQQCHLIYASTPVLAEVLKARFPGKPLFHGMYAAAFEVHLPSNPAVPAAPLTIGYMGSKGHKEDLAQVVPALVALMEERPQLRFETFGTIELPQELRRFGDRVRHHTVQKAYRDFLQTLAELNWSIGLAPLVDEPFNQCKAPTKFIEYACCGIPVVASDVNVYRSAIPEHAGVLVRDDWRLPLTSLLDEPARRLALREAARAHCKREFSARRLQNQLLQVVERAGAPIR